MADNLSVSLDGKKARLTGKGIGNKTSVKMPVSGKSKLGEINIQSKKNKSVIAKETDKNAGYIKGTKIKQHIIGVSGKIGSGKNYLADRLIDSLEAKGYKVYNASLAKPLKNEMSEMIEYIKSFKSANTTNLEKGLANKFALTTIEAKFLCDILLKEVNGDAEVALDANSRTEGIRRALQYLGTEVRRKTDQDYWLKAFHASLPVDADFVIVTDQRFPNEADSIKELDGTIIRMDVSEEVISQRVAQRDNLQYSQEAKTHASETAMDDYEHFDVKLVPDYDVEEVALQLIARTKGK